MVLLLVLCVQGDSPVDFVASLFFCEMKLLTQKKLEFFLRKNIVVNKLYEMTVSYRDDHFSKVAFGES